MISFLRRRMSYYNRASKNPSNRSPGGISRRQIRHRILFHSLTFEGISYKKFFNRNLIGISSFSPFFVGLLLGNVPRSDRGIMTVVPR